MRLYHLTADPERILHIGFTDGEEQVAENGTIHRGVWLSDKPLEQKARVLGEGLLVVEVPDEVAAPFELDMPDGSPYREFCIPAGTVNGFPIRMADARLAPRAVADLLDELPIGAGTLGLLSGDEWSPQTAAFDRAALEAAGPRVAILLAADPDAAPRRGVHASEHFRRLGADPTLVEVRHRSQALAEALPDTDLLSIGGGDPRILMSRLEGTELWDAVLERWRAGMTVTGASAGAMALCQHMLVAEPGATEPTIWSTGLGPLERVALAVHASTRSRAWLAGVVRNAPVPVLALDDATGLILRPTKAVEIVGPGDVWEATGFDAPEGAAPAGPAPQRAAT